MHHSVPTLAFLLAATSVLATSVSLYTDLDRAIFNYSDDPALAVRRYLEAEGIAEEEMVARIEANIAEHVAAADRDPQRYLAAGNSLMALQWMTTPKARERLRAYADEEYPVKLRTMAVRRYLASAKLSGLGLASNVMAQAWRSPDEHNAVRATCMFLTRSAPPEDRAKYVEFLKWAILRMEGASALELDKNLLELDPSWRTDTTRRRSAERILDLQPPPFATGLCNGIIRDYELAAGIRQPVAPPEEAPVAAPAPPPPAPEPPPPATGAPRDVAPPRAAPSAPPDTPAPRSNAPLVALGAVLLATLAAFGVWRHKSKAKAL